MATPISKAKEALLTQEMLRQSHYYNPGTGLFYKRMASGKLKLTGTLHHTGYLQCKINCQNYSAHRLAWLYMAGTWPEEHVDHIDGNKDNNKWNNLRVATNSDNLENQKRARVDNLSTGLLGAYPHGSRFKARITVKGKRLCLGTFNSPEEAHQAYIESKRDLHSFNTL
jgi:hypothetical protein